MTKDVLVSVSGIHIDALDSSDNQSDCIEVVTPASYYCKNGKHYLLYEEVIEGSTDVIKNKIKITGDDSMEIMKSGAANTHMIFEKNKKNLTYYQTPLGQMLIGVNTTSMEVDVSEKKIDVKVKYELDVNHEPLADCDIRVNVTPRIDGEFSLQS